MSNTVNVEVEYEDKTYSITLERGYDYENSNDPEKARKGGRKYDYKAAVRQDVEEAIFWRLEMEGGFAQRVLEEDRRLQDEIIEETQHSIEYDSYFGNEEDAELALVGNKDLVERARMDLDLQGYSAEQNDIIVRDMLVYEIVPELLSELSEEIMEKIEEQADNDPEQEDEEASTR